MRQYPDFKTFLKSVHATKTKMSFQTWIKSLSHEELINWSDAYCTDVLVKFFLYQETQAEKYIGEKI